MRRWWLAAVVALAACSHSFENPLEPGSGFSLVLEVAEQAGVHAVRLKAAPVAHPKVTAFAYFRQEGTGEPQLVGEQPIAEPFFVDQHAEAGKTYRYTVRAKAESGAQSAASAAREVTMAPTPAVTLAAAQVDIGRIELTIGKAAAWITTIELARTSPGDTETARRTVAATGVVEHDDVDEDATYTWTATPQDAFGGSGEPASATLRPAWEVPRGLSAERRLAIPDHVHLTWSPVEKAQGYVVEYAGESEIWETFTTATGTDIELESLSPRASYEWRVRASGANGRTTAPSDVVYTYAPDWRKVLEGGVSDALPGGLAVPRAATTVWEQGQLIAYVVYSDGSAGSVYRRSVDPMGPWRRVYAANFDPTLPLMLLDQGPDVLFPLGRVAGAGKISRIGLVPPDESVLSFSAGSPPERRDVQPVVLSNGTTVFMFGGTGNGGQSLADTLSMTIEDPPAYKTVSYTNAPSPRHGSAAVRLANDEVYVFGGDVDGKLFHVDAAHGEAWTEVGAAGGPGRRMNAAVLANHDENGFFLTGGLDENGQPLANDAVWKFDASTEQWTKRVVTGGRPAPGRIALARLYNDDSLLLGFDAQASWVLDLTYPNLATWTRAETPPSPRADSAAAFDPDNERIFYFGGGNSSGASLGELWSVRPGSTTPWHRYETNGNGPPELAGAAAAWDTQTQTLYVTGPGGAGMGLWSIVPAGGVTWHAVSPQNSLVPVRNAVLAFDRDPASGDPALWLAGGMNEAGLLGDVAVLHPNSAGQQWEKLMVFPAPQLVPGDDVNSGPPRGCFDANVRQIQLVGNTSAAGTIDVWSLSLGAAPAWHHIATTDGPSSGIARAVACSPSEGAIYVRFERLVSGIRVQELWRLDVPGESHVWLKLDLATDPGALVGAAMLGTYDQLWMFGGAGTTRDASSFTSDLWRIPLR